MKFGQYYELVNHEIMIITHTTRILGLRETLKDYIAHRTFIPRY